MCREQKCVRAVKWRQGGWSHSWLAASCRTCVRAHPVCVPVIPGDGSCPQVWKKRKLDWTWSAPKVQLLIQLFFFSACSSFLPAPPSLPPPSLFRMLFQLQTFQDEENFSCNATHTHTQTSSTYIYSFFYLPPASQCFFQASSHSAKNSLKFKLDLLARQGRHPCCQCWKHQWCTNIFISPAQNLHRFISPLWTLAESIFYLLLHVARMLCFPPIHLSHVLHSPAHSFHFLFSFL